MALTNNSIVFLFAAVFFVAGPSWSQTSQISFGHNLSPTVETLSQGQWTAGTYYLGTGLSDQLTVGFSPWMMLGYNLENSIIKYRHSGFNDDQMSHQLAYFNANVKIGSTYSQRSMSYWLTYAKLYDRYKISGVLKYMYFWTEKKPFSLRREPFNNQAQQITLTTLHQFYFSDSITLQFELGF